MIKKHIPKSLKFLIFTFIVANKTYGNVINLDTPLFYSMLANSTAFNNELNILQAKSTLTPLTLYLGGYAQGGANYTHANQSTYFYSTNQTYQSNFDFSLDRTALAAIANVNSWAALYIEAGATNLFQSSTSNLRLDQSYLLLGNDVFPVYGFAGYKNIDFGNFSTVNIFAQPMTRWDYAGTALTAGGGYNAHGFNLTASVLQSDAQGAEDYYGSGLWQVYNYANYYTKNQNTNFALNTSYDLTEAYFNWAIGAGYMRGLWLGNPQNYFDGANIGAWDVNTQIRTENAVLLAEFVQSTPDTYSFGSFTPMNPGGVSLQTWDIGASYSLHNLLLPHTSTLSIDDSGVIGNNSFAEVTQFVLGAKNNIANNVWAGIEYVRDNQSSNQNANRSGIFYRAHNLVQIIRFDVTANF